MMATSPGPRLDLLVRVACVDLSKRLDNRWEVLTGVGP